MAHTIINRLSSSALYKGYEGSESQQKTDALVSKFIEEACDVKTLAPLLAGGLAYRLGRVGVMGLGSSVVGGRWSVVCGPGSVVMGLGAEVTAFEFTNRTLQSFPPPTYHNPSPNLWSWSGPGGWREGLITSAITFSTLKGAGFLARDQNIVLQHALQSTAMVAGHQGAARLGLLPHSEGGLPEQFLEAEVMNLQMVAGLGLVHSLGPRIHAWEKGMDLSLQVKEGGSPPLQNRWAGLFLETASAPPPSPALRAPSPSREREHPHILFMASVGDGKSGSTLPSSHESKSLEEKYQKLFPSKLRPGSRSSVVIQAALGTPCKEPHFHERLLEALSKAPNRGTKEQAYTALAIQDLFHFSDPSSATGSFQNTLHQVLIRRIMADPLATRREPASLELFQAMERGLTRSDLEAIYEKYSYGKDLQASLKPEFPDSFETRHQASLRDSWKEYRLPDQVLLLNAVHEMAGENTALAAQLIHQLGRARKADLYPRSLIDAVMNRARVDPFGRLILRRMIQVIRTEDVEAKLAEMIPEKGLKTPAKRGDFFKNFLPSFLGAKTKTGIESLEWIKTLSDRGLSKDEIAHRINFSRHTAYLNDMRLARKVVAMSLKVYPHIREEPSHREKRREEFQKKALPFLKDSRTQPSGEDYLKVLEALEMPLPSWMRDKIKSGDLKIEVLSEKAFEEEDYGLKGADKHLARFVIAEAEVARPHTIQIREIPSEFFKTFSRSKRIKAFADRISALVHEIGHYKIWTGLDEEIQGYPEGPLPMGHRHQVLASEIMANLEEQPFKTRYWETEPWIIADRLGENFPLYIRMVNDHLYYGEVNEWLAKGLRDLP